MSDNREFLRRWALIVPAVLAAVAETVVLSVAGPPGSAALGPQVTAPAPIALFHDLRWVSVYHNSWWSLGVELTAVVILRSAYSAWVAVQSWPGEGRPALHRAFLRAAPFYAIASIVLFTWVALLFGLAITHVSYLFFVAFPGALAMIFILHRGASSQAAGWWWRWAPSLVSAGWIAASLAWLTAAGAVISIAPLWAGALAAAGAGLLNARADFGIVRDLLAPRRARRRAPALPSRLAAPVALIATFALIVGGATAGFAAVSPPPTGVVTPRIPASAAGHPVLLVSGFNSSWTPPTDISLPPGYVAWRYSYRGIKGGRLEPYSSRDTLQSLMLSARRMAAEVQALHRAYRSPVAIVAESEGALVARTYLLNLYRPRSGSVDKVILLSMPEVQPTAYYPPAGQAGWGLGTGWAIRGIAYVIRGIGPLRFTIDSPFLRDLVDCPSLTHRIATEAPPQGVEELDVQALADAVNAPYPAGLPEATDLTVASVHGGMLKEPDIDRLIASVLQGSGHLGRAGLHPELEHLIAAAADPWHAPELTAGLAPTNECGASG